MNSGIAVPFDNNLPQHNPHPADDLTLTYRTGHALYNALIISYRLPSSATYEKSTIPLARPTSSPDSPPLQGNTLATMASFLDNSYSLVHLDNTADQPSQQDLKTQLEKGTDETKVETMTRILTIMLNGDPMPNLLMHIIRFVMPSKSKPLKKLLYFYYELCPKHDANGKLKQEMILVWYVADV